SADAPVASPMRWRRDSPQTKPAPAAFLESANGPFERGTDAPRSFVNQALSAAEMGLATVMARRRCARNAIVAFRLLRRAVSILATIGYAGLDLSKTVARSSSV